jgi:hypothetical protein
MTQTRDVYDVILTALKPFIGRVVNQYTIQEAKAAISNAFDHVPIPQIEPIDKELYRLVADSMKISLQYGGHCPVTVLTGLTHTLMVNRAAVGQIEWWKDVMVTVTPKPDGTTTATVGLTYLGVGDTCETVCRVVW